MSGLSDYEASVNQHGNLSLGVGGLDDQAGHGTYKYAKNDVTMPVPASMIVSDTLPALTWSTGNIPMRALAASTTHKVAVPFPQFLTRTFVGRNTQGANANSPKGVLVKSLALAYRVNTTTITSATMAILHAPLVAGAGLPTITTPTATVAGNTLTAAADVYLMVCTITAPAWINTADALIWGLATIVIPASSTVDLFGASWRVALALY
jgi:hypothetical protein